MQYEVLLPQQAWTVSGLWWSTAQLLLRTPISIQITNSLHIHNRLTHTQCSRYQHLFPHWSKIMLRDRVLRYYFVLRYLSLWSMFITFLLEYRNLPEQQLLSSTLHLPTCLLIHIRRHSMHTHKYIFAKKASSASVSEPRAAIPKCGLGLQRQREREKGGWEWGWRGKRVGWEANE